MSDPGQKKKSDGGGDVDVDAISAQYRQLLALQQQAIRALDRTDRLDPEWRARIDAVKSACLAAEDARRRLIRGRSGGDRPPATTPGSPDEARPRPEGTESVEGAGADDRRYQAQISTVAGVAAGFDDDAHPAFRFARRCWKGVSRRGARASWHYDGERADMLALLYYLEFSPAFESPDDTGCDRREHRALRRAAAAFRAALELPAGEIVAPPT